MSGTRLKNRCYSRMFRSLNPAQERNPGAGLLSGVQNALSGFPLKTCLHAEVRRFGTQACGNDNYSCGRILEMASNLLLILVFLQVLPILLEIFHV